MAVNMLSPFNLDIFAYIGLLMNDIDFRRKAIVAKVVSYRRLSSASLGLLPYKLMVVSKALPVLITIFLICVARALFYEP